MRKTVDKITRNALVVLMAILVLDVVWQVFSRYILNAPSTFTDELARYLLIWVSLLGAAYISGQNAHIAIEVLPQRLNPKNRLRLMIFLRVLIIAFVLAVLVVGGGYQMYLKYLYHEISPALQISMGWVYLIGPLSGVLIIYYKLSDITRLIKYGELNPDDVVNSSSKESHGTT